MNEFLQAALEVSYKAGDLLLANFGQKQKVVEERGGHILIEADLTAEKEILKTIQKKFPTHSIISEAATIEKKGEYNWVLDPLDGTKAYVSGLPFWGVSVCLLKENKPTVAVIYLPTFNELYSATKGGGSWMNKKEIKVSQTKSLKDVLVDFATGDKSQLEKIENVLLKVAPKVRRTVDLASCALALAFVAKGTLGAYIEEGIECNDIAAGALLVKEAGGRVTDLTGKEIDYTKSEVSILATNGKVHQEVLSVLDSPSESR